MARNGEFGFVENVADLVTRVSSSQLVVVDA